MNTVPNFVQPNDAVNAQHAGNGVHTHLNTHAISAVSHAADDQRQAGSPGQTDVTATDNEQEDCEAASLTPTLGDGLEALQHNSQQIISQACFCNTSAAVSAVPSPTSFMWIVAFTIKLYFFCEIHGCTRV